MAGGAQGGGARPAQGQAGQANPQANLQAGQQFQQALQNYRQGSMGMPSQVPGANVAAPVGNMMQNPAGYGPPQQALPMYAGPAPAPQQMMDNTRPMQAPQISQPPQAPTAQVDTPLQQMPPAQQQQMEALGAQIRAQGGFNPMSIMRDPQQVAQFFNNLRQNMGGNRPQIMGNPNATPLQRPQRFNPGMMMGRGRNG